MRSVSTKQKCHTQDKNPPLQDHSSEQCAPLHPNRNGPNHRATQEPGVRQYSNHSRPRVLPGRGLPALPLHYHRTPDCSIVLSTRLPLVWTPLADHIRPGPSFHFAFWKGPSEGAEDRMEPVNGIPPPDGRPHGAKEPRTGATDTTSGNQSGRLEQRVAPPDSVTQQRGKLHDWDRT
jgi:hypothetical protein